MIFFWMHWPVKATKGYRKNVIRAQWQTEDTKMNLNIKNKKMKTLTSTSWDQPVNIWSWAACSSRFLLCFHPHRNNCWIVSLTSVSSTSPSNELSWGFVMLHFWTNKVKISTRDSTMSLEKRRYLRLQDFSHTLYGKKKTIHEIYKLKKATCQSLSRNAARSTKRSPRSE